MPLSPPPNHDIIDDILTDSPLSADTFIHIKQALADEERYSIAMYLADHGDTTRAELVEKFGEGVDAALDRLVSSGVVNHVSVSENPENEQFSLSGIGRREIQKDRDIYI